MYHLYKLVNSTTKSKNIYINSWIVPFSYKKSADNCIVIFFTVYVTRGGNLQFSGAQLDFQSHCLQSPPPTHPKVHDIVLRTEPFFSLKKMRSRIADFIDNESSLSLSFCNEFHLFSTLILCGASARERYGVCCQWVPLSLKVFPLI